LKDASGNALEGESPRAPSRRFRVAARANGALAAATLACCCLPAAAAAQRLSYSGYYQNVGTVSGRLGASGTVAADLQRLRLMLEPTLGPVDGDVALEQTFTWQGTGAAAMAFGLLSSTRAGDDWLGIDWTIHDSQHVVWRQRLDRLNVAISHGAWSLRLGRQAISWATTLFLTPADPFVPLDPSDPFREYRRGVDAARLQWYPGPLSVVDLVVRPAGTPYGNTATVVARGKTTLAGWELSAWGGAVHDAAGGGAGLTRSVGGSALRAEVTLREDSSGGLVLRGAIGLDRRVSLAGRDLYGVIEYQHDGFGAASAAQLPAVALSRPAARGELQVLGRDEATTQLTYQLHPLVELELLALWNLRDGSGLVAPAATFSVSNEVTARAGMFLAVGPAGPSLLAPASEYGPLPPGAYLAVSAFF
jgi:hypothetical protein